MTTQLIDCIPKFSEAQRIVTYPDGLPPIGDLRYPYGHRQVKVNALREPHKGGG